MKKLSVRSFVLLFAMASCISQIEFDIGDASPDAIVIDGRITDQPGPYTVRLTRAFDIQSKLSFKTEISANRVAIFDNHGQLEELTEVRRGVYQTSTNGIRGIIGDVYTVHVELRDGRIYESIPDTLQASGQVDSIYYDYKRIDLDSVARPFLEVFFNASKGPTGNSRYLWNFIATYKVDTNPELYDTICADGRCPKPLPCSGYVINKEDNGIKSLGPCVCCTCWVDFFNQRPIVSAKQIAQNDKFKGIRAAYIPINQWTFMYKVHVEIRQISLSYQAFNFWKAASAQDDAVTSLFQPVIGKIPSSFVQLEGEPTPVTGIFYAGAETSSSIFIKLGDLPTLVTVPPVDPLINNSCLQSFANSTTIRPSFWID